MTYLALGFKLTALDEVVDRGNAEGGNQEEEQVGADGLKDGELGAFGQRP